MGMKLKLGTFSFPLFYGLPACTTLITIYSRPTSSTIIKYLEKQGKQ